MKHCLWVLCLFVAVRASAQIKVTNLTYTKAVNVSPISLADIDNTAMVGGEYRFKNHLAVLADVGYVFYTSYMEEAEKTRGFNIRPSMRIYYGRSMARYFQIQAGYKHVNYSVHDWVNKEVVNGVPSFQQKQDFIYRKQVASLSFMIGRMILLGSDDWFADVYLGLGLRYRKLGVAGEEDFTYTLDRGLFGPPQERLISLHLPFNIRIAHTFE